MVNVECRGLNRVESRAWVVNVCKNHACLPLKVKPLEIALLILRNDTDMLCLLLVALPSPSLSIQIPISNCLGNVFCFYIVASFKIRNGSAYFQDPVKCSCREI